MRRSVIDNVQIVEPPLNELTKKNSGFKKGCFFGCLFTLILFIILVVSLRFAAGPGPQVLKSVPANFPADIPIYAPDNIEQITYIAGKYKSRSLEIAAFFPKLILSPLLVQLNPDKGTAAAPGQSEPTWKKIWRVIIAPIGNHRDTITIQWAALDAEPSFVISYFKKELQKKNFKIDLETSGDTINQFSFSRADGLSGSLYVQGDEQNKPGTDIAILTVSLPATDTTSTTP